MLKLQDGQCQAGDGEAARVGSNSVLVEGIYFPRYGATENRISVIGFIVCTTVKEAGLQEELVRIEDRRTFPTSSREFARVKVIFITGSLAY